MKKLLWIGVWIAGLALTIGVLWGVGHCLNKNISDPVQFITGNLLNTLIFVAIVAQVYIYRKQWDVMERQWRDGQRAYVGIHSIAASGPRGWNPWLKIQNIGKLPADDVGVEIQMILLVPLSTIKKYSNHPLEPIHAPDMFWVSFLRTKLFRGGVCFDVEVPLEETLKPAELMCVSNAEARLVIQVRLKYSDGFSRGESDYAFRWDSGWKSWPVWTRDDLPSRIAEEQSRYHPT